MGLSQIVLFFIVVFSEQLMLFGNPFLSSTIEKLLSQVVVHLPQTKIQDDRTRSL